MTLMFTAQQQLLAGNLPAAKKTALQQLSLDPENAECWHYLGVIAFQEKDLTTAIQHFRKSLAIEPSSADCLNNLGFALMQQPDTQEAGVASFQQALLVNPQHEGARINLAALLVDRKAFDEALAVLEPCVSKKPCSTRVLQLKALCLDGHGEFEEAVQLLEMVIRREPENGEAYLNLCHVYQRQQRFEEAIICGEKAVLYDSHSDKAKINLSNALLSECRCEEAEVILNKIPSTSPYYVEARINLGFCYDFFGDQEKALACYEHAKELAPNNLHIQYNIGLFALWRGDFHEGWKGMLLRHELEKYGRRYLLEQQYFPYPQWRGETRSTQHVLIRADQGIADQLMYATCISDALNHVGRATITCHPKLLVLFQRSFPTAMVLSEDPNLLNALQSQPDIDAKCKIGDLAAFYRNSLADFDRRPEKFLVLNEARRIYWRDYLSTFKQTKKIALVWRSSQQAALRNLTYLKLKDFVPLLQQQGVTFFSLQYPEDTAEIAEIETALGITLQRPPQLDVFNDLDDTAAFLAEVDEVIGPATTTVFLGAACGMSTRLLVPYGGVVDMFGTDRYPWYPTIYVYPQLVRGDWLSAVKQLSVIS